MYLSVVLNLQAKMDSTLLRVTKSLLFLFHIVPPHHSTQTTTSSPDWTRYLNNIFGYDISDDCLFSKIVRNVTGFLVCLFLVACLSYCQHADDDGGFYIVQADTYIYSLCSIEEKHLSGISCINQEDVYGAMHMFNATIEELERRKVALTCLEDFTSFAFMTNVKRQEGLESILSAKEIINRCQENGSCSMTEVIKDLHNMEYLITQNPRFHVLHCDWRGYELQFDEVIEIRDSQLNFFKIQMKWTDVPFKCRLLRLLKISLVFIISLVCLSLLDHIYELNREHFFNFINSIWLLARSLFLNHLCWYRRMKNEVLKNVADAV